ncbi:beta-ketoacyl-ACP synthase [Rhizomicrobium electricum]|uniref:Beta-ketoacyl-ACP synthase n=2 Tax=Rhizomicrobium electricum TaxID=480070 RepID=A0ABP3PUL3_9PROT
MQTMAQAIYIHDFAVLCALGSDTETVRRNLLAPAPPRVSGTWTLTDGRTAPVGAVTIAAQPNDPDSRCNAMADRCLAGIDPALWNVADKSRLAVVMGTSSCGLLENGAAFQRRLADGAWPPSFRLAIQEFGNVAAHIANRVGATGPTYGISTACTSGAKALASGARLIQSGMADVVIAGGFDALCDLTLNGFSSLEALADGVSNPFSVNRRGINLGEGGALFVLSAEPSPIRLAGWGESADAYHISAPDPEGNGAEAAMREALVRAGLKPENIGYLNLHGTGTKLNDLMEARAVNRVFGDMLPCSTTKPLTGHMLGAAGAGEAAFTIMALQAGRLPGNAWDGERDPEMPPIRLVKPEGEATDGRAAMSCSYAFGGNNIALILEVAR